MTDSRREDAPAGWYADPERPEPQRFWDGSAWTPFHAVVYVDRASAPESVAKPRHRWPLATIALILALVGLICGVIPSSVLFAWIAFVPALVLAVLVLRTRRPGRIQAVIALTTLTIGWALSLGIGAVTFFEAVSRPNPGTGNPAYALDSSALSGSAVPPPSAGPPGIGTPVSGGRGVSFTVTAVRCGIAEQYGVETLSGARGQFCSIDFTVENAGTAPRSVSYDDIFGYVGDTRYATNSNLGFFGDENYSAVVDAGDGIKCRVFVDIPKDASLDKIQMTPLWWAGDGAFVELR